MAPDKTGVAGITGKPTIIVSAVLITAILWLALEEKMPLFGDRTDQWLPFTASIVGVLLYVMSSAKTRRERFDLKYLSDYFFRGAQAVVYLYIILGFMAQNTQQIASTSFKDWSPITIGLFVGLFIPHVEKAMEGFGQRFEEALAAIFPRALTSKTSRERQLERLRSETKFQEIQTQAEGLLSQYRGEEVGAAFQQRLKEVQTTIRNKDDDGITDQVRDLAWDFEKIKQAVREEELTMEDILRRDVEEKD